MDELQYRSIIATESAHAMLIEFLLRTAFKDLNPPDVDKIANILKERAHDTSWFAGRYKGDEARSERLADMVVQMQEHATKIIDSAALAVKQVAETRRSQGQ